MNKEMAGRKEGDMRSPCPKPSVLGTPSVGDQLCFYSRSKGFKVLPYSPFLSSGQTCPGPGGDKAPDPSRDTAEQLHYPHCGADCLRQLGLVVSRWALEFLSPSLRSPIGSPLWALRGGHWKPWPALPEGSQPSFAGLPPWGHPQWPQPPRATDPRCT